MACPRSRAPRTGRRDGVGLFLAGLLAIPLTLWILQCARHASPALVTEAVGALWWYLAAGVAGGVLGGLGAFALRLRRLRTASRPPELPAARLIVR